MPTSRLALVVLLVGLGSSSAWAQSQDTTEKQAHPTAVVERVTDAFTTGAVGRLLAPATDRVEISLFGTRTYYSSSQAFYVLRDFFAEYAPRRFVVEDVTETGRSCFVTGVYEHDHSDRLLQVYVRLVQQEENTWRLHEVRIDTGAE